MTRAADPVACAHRRLAAATSIDEVLAQVAAFLQELPQERLDALPSHCRPRRVALQQDVLHWAQRLNRERILGAHGTRSRAFRVVHDFFAHASRQANLLRPRRDLEPGAPMPRRAAPPWPRPSDRRPS